MRNGRIERRKSVCDYCKYKSQDEDNVESICNPCTWIALEPGSSIYDFVKQVVPNTKTIGEYFTPAPHDVFHDVSNDGKAHVIQSEIIELQIENTRLSKIVKKLENELEHLHETLRPVIKEVHNQRLAEERARAAEEALRKMQWDKYNKYNDYKNGVKNQNIIYQRAINDYKNKIKGGS